MYQASIYGWAYTVNSQTIPVHKKPASLEPKNALFNKIVAGLCVCSEHCIGALKRHFQCLHGLQVHINSNNDHYEACKGISVAIILHNIVINVEGYAEHFRNIHGHDEEEALGFYEENGEVDINNKFVNNDANIGN